MISSTSVTISICTDTWVVYVKIIVPHRHFQSLLPAFNSMVVWMWIASSDSYIWRLHLQVMELFGSLRRYGLVRGGIPLCGSRSLVPFTLCSLHFVMSEYTSLNFLSFIIYLPSTHTTHMFIYMIRMNLLYWDGILNYHYVFFTYVILH